MNSIGDGSRDSERDIRFESMTRRPRVRCYYATVALWHGLECEVSGALELPWTYVQNNLVALHFKYDFRHMTATAGSDVVQSGRPIFDDFFQHLWPYISNNTANVVFQMVKRLWLIRIDQ
ncbi:adhesion G protein-coupled receptor B2 [Trichonephila clavipes]|nr:adhesion G protein-coupled receptor B2 [Trichonephila clavipes]